jgi:hypothetical protein
MGLRAGPGGEPPRPAIRARAVHGPHPSLLCDISQAMSAAPHSMLIGNRMPHLNEAGSPIQLNIESATPMPKADHATLPRTWDRDAGGVLISVVLMHGYPGHT